jgi:hypothetical protein
VSSETQLVAPSVNALKQDDRSEPADRSTVVQRLLASSRAWRVPFQRQELSYNSPSFRAASELAKHLSNPPQVSALIGRVVRDRTLIPVLMAIYRLPVVDLQARRADVDAWGPVYFNPVRSSRLAQAVLELPTVEKDYLRGRSKQALRTNLRHARAIGITSARVPSYEVWFEAMSVILRARRDADPEDWELYGPTSAQQVAYYVARDAEDTPLACARVALFGDFGVLFSMLSRPDLHPVASYARYKLHTCLSLDLGTSGYKKLLVGSALKETVGTQYFQHLLGYHARNLRIKVIDAGRS